MKDNKMDFPGKNKRRMQLHSEAATEFFGFNLTENSDFNTLVTGDGSSAATPRPSEDPNAEFVGLYEPDRLNIKTEYPDGISENENTGNSINVRARKDKSNSADKCGEKVADAYRKNGKETDPFGSWTGHSYDDLSDVPVQDVDDL